jgi:hypothetical protein
VLSALPSSVRATVPIFSLKSSKRAYSETDKEKKKRERLCEHAIAGCIFPVACLNTEQVLSFILYAKGIKNCRGVNLGRKTLLFN